MKLLSKISRRSFMALSILGTLSATAYAMLISRSSTYEDLVRSVLRKRLDYLELEQEGVSKFFNDFEKRYPFEDVANRFWLKTFEPVYSYTPFIQFSPLNGRFYVFEKLVVESYMLSTDFFLNGEDENQVVNYIAFHDPYEQPCFNPFGSV